MEKTILPNYHKIYSDIIRKKYPEKKSECNALLSKEKLTVLDIVELNDKIFGKANKLTNSFNQKRRSYNKSDILHILDYQKKHRLNNTQLANHFKLSRNSVAKWKTMFVV